jgi:hypothetical protein
MLERLDQRLDQFDAAVTLSTDGRTAHRGATRELQAVAIEIPRTVRAMDARNRQRFQNDGQLLAWWISANTVLVSPRGTAGGSGTARSAGTPRGTGMPTAP